MSTLPACLAALAQAHPERQAVTAPFPYSLKELRDHAHTIAAALAQAGIGPGDRVAVALTRDAGLLAGLWGVMETGAAYVPLDLKLPLARQTALLKSARPKALLISRALAAQAPAGVPPLILEALPEAPPWTPRALDPESPAYVLFTSGTTGQPKGVVVPHRALVCFLDAMSREPGLSPADTLLAITTLSFDIAGLELFLPLWTGAKLVLAPAEVARDPAALKAALAEHSVTVLQATPSTWRMLLEAGLPEGGLRAALTGGEALPADLVPALQRCAREVWNLYGPTETTIWSTAGLITELEVHIGRPILGTVVEVVDESGAPLPAGQTGELWIGGEGLALGYLDDPALTAARFVEARGRRWFKTGDRALVREDGRLSCLGRLDQQVKLRGHRIELLEVEAHLLAHPEVQAAAVVLQGEGAGARLCAFVVPTGPSDEGLSRRLQAFVGLRAPSAWVPSLIEPVAALPLSPSGKVDRKALAQTELAVPASTSARAATPAERPLLAAMSEILGWPLEDPDLPFLSAGGDSLSAARLAVKLSSRLQRPLSLAEVLAHPSASALAAWLCGEPSKDDAPPPPPSAQEAAVASPAQLRHWLAASLDGESAVTVQLELTGPLDVARLMRAWDQVVAHQEALRTSLTVDAEGVLRPAISERGPALTQVADPAALDALTLEGAPVSAALWVGEDRAELRVLLHHAFADAFAPELLQADLATAYAGEPLTVRPAARYAHQLAQLAASADDALTQATRRLAAPPPYPRWRAPSDSAAAEVPLVLGEVLTQALEALARAEGVSLFAALVSALYPTLDEPDLLLAFPASLRAELGAQEALGDYGNTGVVRLKAASSPLARLRQAGQALEAALSELAVPFEQVVAALRRAGQPMPLTPFCCALQPPQAPARWVEALRIEAKERPARTTPFALTFQLRPSASGLEGSLIYRPALLSRDEATALAARFVAEVSALVRAPAAPLTRLLGGPLAAPLPKTLPELLDRACELAPDRGLIDGRDDRRLTYPTLRAQARALAATLSAWPTGPVLVVAASPLAHLLAFWTCAVSGRPPVSLTAPATFDQDTLAVQRLLTVWENLKRPPLLGDDEAVAGLSRLAARKGISFVFRKIEHLDAPTREREDGTAEPLPNRSEECRDESRTRPQRPTEPYLSTATEEARTKAGRHPAEPLPAVLALTSGSTGAPRAARLTHPGLIAQAAGFAAHVGLGPDDPVVNWQAMDHVGSLLMCHLGAIYRGAWQIHTPPDWVLGSPLRWLSLIDRYRAAFSWAPNFAWGLVTDALLDDEDESRETPGRTAGLLASEECRDGRTAGLAGWDLSCVKVLLNGGEAVVARTVRGFYQATAPFGLSPKTFTPAWGMAEVCSATIARPGAPLDELADEVPVAVGGPIPGFAFEIADERGEPCPPGQVGRLLVQGASRALGYLGQDFDAWFDTGDLGLVDHRGLTLTGRAKEVLVLRGAKLDPEEVEALVETLPGVAPTLAVAMPWAGQDTDGFAVAFVPQGDAPAIAKAVGGLLTRRFGVSPTATFAIAPEDVPKTAIGKRQRGVLCATLVSRVGAQARGFVDARPAPIYRPRWVALPLVRAPLPPLEVHGDQLPGYPQAADAPVVVLSARSPELTVDQALTALLALANDPRPLVILTPTGGPVAAALSALAGGLGLELARPVKVLALDDLSDLAVALPAALATPDTELRWHQGELLGLKFAPTDARPAAPLNGPALIAGGLGGIGRRLAERLLDQGAGPLLLLGRTPRTRLNAEQRAALTSLASRGAHYRGVDIADAAALTQAVLAHEADFGPLTAVYHLAGVARQAALAQEDDTAAELLAWRAQGTANLAALVAARPGARYVEAGTVHAWIPGLSVAVYGAASRLGVAHVEALRAQGRDAFHVAMAQWDGVGMSPPPAVRARAKAVGLLGVETAAGLQALITPAGSCSLIGLSLEAPALRAWRLTPTPIKEKTEVPLATPPSDPLALSQKTAQIAAVFGQVLACEVGPDDAFFDLGGHSLLVPKVLAMLGQKLGVAVTANQLFAHPTPASLAEALSQPSDVAAVATPQAPVHASAAARAGDVAIIGVAGRFPGSGEDLDRFFASLVAGQVSVTRFPIAQCLADGVPESLAHDPDFVPMRCVLADAESFDAAFFGYSPREAELLCPQQRIFLECCHHALEDAALEPSAFEGRVGVFGGGSAPTYLINNLLTQPDRLLALGGVPALLANDKDHISTRVAFELGLTGPAVTVLTACSTSLVAVALACQSLKARACDAALAGGASVAVPIHGGHRYQPGGIYSADGHCRAYDAAAQGMMSGDGAAAVVLMRAEDALAQGFPIRAFIRGVGLNNDGAHKAGYIAPNPQAQTEAIVQALTEAKLKASQIAFVEGHGTGTALGDPIEVAALSRAFAQCAGAPARSCALASVKANIGHLNAAAGVAGLVKAVLTLERGLIPPCADFVRPLPALELDKTPFYIPKTAIPFPDDKRPRRGALSSFGAGGTNAHVVLEEAPPARPATPCQTAQALKLSAKTPTALAQVAARLADHLERHPEQSLADVAYTLERGRRALPCRAVVVATAEEAPQALLAPLTVSQAERARPVVFVFPGQGFQKVNMGRALYEQVPTFRAAVDRVATLALAHGEPDFRPVLYPPPGQEDQATLDDQRYAGAALFALEIALAELWRASGVKPSAVLGHSTGEYAAAAVAGVLSVEDALAIFLARARAMDALPKGAMLLVATAPAKLDLPEGVYLALVNGPSACVVSGTPEAVAAYEASLAPEIRRTWVPVSVPAHSPLLAPVAEPLNRVAHGCAHHAPALPFFSGVVGQRLSDAEAQDPGYWVRHLLSTVRFDQAVAEVCRWTEPLFVELGPARSVGGLVQLNAPTARLLPGLPPNEEAARYATWLPAAAWAEGAKVEPLTVGQRVRLPGYPFERVRCFVDPAAPAILHPTPAAPGAKAAPKAPAPVKKTSLFSALKAKLSPAKAAAAEPPEAPAAPPPSTPARPRPALPTPYVAPRSPEEQTLADICERLLGVAPVGVDDDFFALGADSLITLRLVDEVRSALGREFPPTAAFGGLTVARLAAHLTGEAPQATDWPPSLVAIRTTGTKPPMFIVHPAAGPVFPYFELARKLGDDQPFYGFQAHGLDGQTEPDHTVEAMADTYLAALRKILPPGQPFSLAGYSFGGLIAFEMARKLAATDERPFLLTLIDEPAPLPGHRPTIPQLLRVFADAAIQSFVPHMHDYFFLRTGSGGLAAAFKRFVEGATMATILPPDSPLRGVRQPGLSPMFRLFLIHLVETLRYQAASPYDGETLLLRANSYERWDQSEDLGWRPLLTGPVEIQPLTGDHLSTIREPDVRVLAQHLTRALERVHPTGGLKAR